MGKNISIRRGYDIKMRGVAEKTITNAPFSAVIAVKPPDFYAVTPKLLVEAGQEVLAGQGLFCDKDRPHIQFPSPVSGEVAEIVRGEKRRLLEIRIIPDQGEQRYQSFPIEDPESLDREAITHRLLASGCWAYIRQRPFSLIAHPDDTPKGIFVSCFDSAPLAPDLDYIVDREKDNFHAGLMALQTLAGGKLHLGIREGFLQGDYYRVLQEHIHTIKGPHPAGNVGIQIHHIDPIDKGEIAWYVHPQDVLIIGRLFREGRYRADRLVALTGSGVLSPHYIHVKSGQSVSDIVSGQLRPEAAAFRLIQGNILTGKTATPADFLSFYENQITVIPEGVEPEFLGWLTPGIKKLSLSRTYFSWLFPKRSYDLNTNTHGEERAFVMTGQYDKVLPMNIYPVFLLKAILAKDIERMEQLGIYEVSEEDFALCEFVCTSKIDVQKIIAEGLELARKEG